jgi:magnesium chelatase family protein
MEVVPREDLCGYAALGELSLDGTLNPVAGVLPAAIGASTLDLGLICPASQGGEAAWAGRIDVLAAPDLLSLINHFRGTQVLTPPEAAGFAEAARAPDLADVKGMETAKRALEIAAAGGHNLLMIGSPGSGKSMLAARLHGLLPDLSPKEALEVSMIHSVAGMLDSGRLVMHPPFREPHHSASQAALTGGGQRAKPGEISLAHRGVLFLDELPEFPRQTLESLRQSMETGRTTVARAAAHITYPARFQLVAAMNPCRCGHFGDASRECGRAPRCAEDYQNRISGPVLDRIDLTVEVQPASAAELARAPPGGHAMARMARPAMPRPTAAMSRWRPRRTRSRSERWSNCGCRHGATPGCCASAARSPTSPVPRRYSGRMLPRHWRSGIGCRDGESDPGGAVSAPAISGSDHSGARAPIPWHHRVTAPWTTPCLSMRGALTTG